MQQAQMPFRLNFNDEPAVVIPRSMFDAIHEVLSHLKLESDAWDRSSCPWCHEWYDFPEKHEKGCKLAELIHATRPWNEDGVRECIESAPESP